MQWVCERLVIMLFSVLPSRPHCGEDFLKWPDHVSYSNKVSAVGYVDYAIRESQSNR